MDQVKLVKQHGGRVKVCIFICIHHHMFALNLSQDFFNIYAERLKARGVRLAQPRRRFYDWVRKARLKGDKVRARTNATHILM